MSYSPKLVLLQGKITRFAGDAIVNPASRSLLGGSGIDGAIHRAAGPRLLVECLSLGGCKTGEAKITAGHNLPVNYVIHTVGPVWRGGGYGEADLLTSCYHASLTLASEHSIETIAFPPISVGVNGFPLDAATAIAVATTNAFLEAHVTPLTVTFVCEDDPTYFAYFALLGE